MTQPKKSAPSTRQNAKLLRQEEFGAALVETALIIPVIALLLTGFINGALLIRTTLSLSHGTEAGARIGSAKTASPEADYEVLQAVKHETSGLGVGSIKRVVIYEATSAGQPPPDVCINPNTVPGDPVLVANSCNVYGPDDLDLPRSQFALDASNPPLATLSWPSAERTQSRQETPKYLGVYLLAGCKCWPAVFGIDSSDITRHAAVRLEATEY